MHALHTEITMTNLHRLTKSFAVAALLACAMPAAQAQDAQHLEAATAAAPAADGMSTGEVVKVDKATGRLTLRHGPLDNLGMGAMTMVFRVAEPAMLEQIRPGDKVRFVADMVGGALTVTTLQKN